tara:strand:- start:765 stop:1001 length:237 start_codon:yes stop_codon:yes gene_type:complete
MKKKQVKGKMSRIFQELKEGDRVAVIIDVSENKGFPKRIHGKTGVIEKRKGKAYIVKIRDNNKEKQYIIKPVHLKKLI